MASIYLQTTEIAAEKSVMEIMKEITKRGATEVRQTYDNGVITGLAFLIRLPDGATLPVSLPARVDRMIDVLTKSLGPRQLRSWPANKIRERAYRIVWRQLAFWIKAQMALIDLQIARPEEVFLPYFIDAQGKTLYDRLAAGKFKALGAGAA